jgi:hypothetical protein
MENLSDKHLKEALYHAKQLELDPAFIRLLKAELSERSKKKENIQKESGENVI